MVVTPQDEDAELAAIAAINSALAKLPDVEARQRVMNYVLARHLPQVLSGQLAVQGVHGSAAQPSNSVPQSENELPGVARVTADGELKITARDLKAKSGLDAAVRLAHIAIYAYDRLVHQPLSSRKGLTPLLREWRLYDGNTRARLAKERGIIRSGDSLSLDAHARRDAEQFIEEILGDEHVGHWRPR